MLSIRQVFKGYYKYCECWCGELIPYVNVRNKLAKFKTHHNLKPLRGEEHPAWNGGLRKTNRDYTRLYAPNHPFKDNNNTIFLHRWIYEQHYNCILLPYTDIHHIDKNIENNNIENLQPIYRNGHTRLHNENREYKLKDNDDWRCSICGLGTYIKPNGRPHWYYDENGQLLCKKCYDKLITIPKRKEYKKSYQI